MRSSIILFCLMISWTPIHPNLFGSDFVDTPLDPLDLPDIIGRQPDSPLPFSFTYDDQPLAKIFKSWELIERKVETGSNSNRDTYLATWIDQDAGLQLEWSAIKYHDFPAVEWTLHFENTGSKDTPIISDIQTLDLRLSDPRDDDPPYILHRTKGGSSSLADFEDRLVDLRADAKEILGGAGGRSSNKDFPFFKIDTGSGALIVAVGWSGQWRSEISSSDGKWLQVTAGMETTHFRLHPGERVRLPSILLLNWTGDPWEANAQFRQLLYKHYIARRPGHDPPLPVSYCNTCFTRGGSWLNETTAENQISLIKAYAKLGVEALLTDAGWFEGGWPDGAGTWTARRDHYPDGMAPVAQAAKDHGMIYGLWFEIERVIKGTRMDRLHHDWILWTPDWTQATTTGDNSDEKETGLANFALPEVRDYFIDNVKQFMDLPGFGVYRQDFNLNPLRYWRHNEAPDRKGMLEIRYMEGLYDYWDRIAETWPDSFRINCAGGGRRIDLEIFGRMNVTQKTDNWFNNELNQASLWSLSQYLPNNFIMVPINRLDDYSFHSALASSLNLGWIADAPDFDMERARELLDRYRAIRHLLVGAWYPLTHYSLDLDRWHAVQYHRPDLDEGMVLVFRRERSPYRSAVFELHALDPQANYAVASDRTGITRNLSGAALMADFEIVLPEKHQSDMIAYRKVADAQAGEE